MSMAGRPGDGPVGKGQPGNPPTVGVSGSGQIPRPNPEVTRIEDVIVKNTLSTALATPSLDLALPRRPAYGKVGKPIILYANYFELKGIKPDTHLYRYSIDFGGVTISREKKKQLVEILLQTPPLAQLKVATDWSQKLVCAEQIPLAGEHAEYTLVWSPKAGLLYPQTDESRQRNTYHVRVTKLGEVSLSELLQNLSQPAPTYALKLDTIDALNTVIAYGSSSEANITTAARSRFYPFNDHPQVQVADLGHALQALRGYFASVRTSVNRVMVNVNVAAGAFHKPENLLLMMKELVGRSLLDDRWDDEREHKKLNTLYYHVKIETHYLRMKSTDVKKKEETRCQVHSIANFSPSGKNSTNVRFRKHDAEGKVITLTVEEHFRQAHNIRLSHPQAPLVNYGKPEKPMWMPAELCKILPGQLVRQLLLPSQTSEMIKFASRRPDKNMRSITSDGLKVTKIEPIVNGQNVNLEAFGIKVDPDMVTVHGRILPPPIVQYRAQSCTPNNGAWNLDPKKLGSRPFHIAKTLGPWRILVINSGSRPTIPGGIDGLKHALEQFKKALIQYGMQPGEHNRPCMVDIKPEQLAKKNIDEIQEQIRSSLVKSFKEKPRFLFALLPSDNTVLYDSIKLLFDCKLGLPSVCCIGSKFAKLDPHYFANVAMKFNQKLGGVNHTVPLAKLAPLDAQTIIFGIDVTHPSPGSSQTAPSIAGVVASVDAKFSQYAASMRTQARRVEMVAELEEMIVERLELWKKRNQNRLPNKVIVYRDGVSEGDYGNVLNKECESFEAAFDKLYGKEKHPKLSFIIVGKRHHTRFYPTQPGDADVRTGNPKAGTIVDRGVTGEKLFDFFLIAHQGLQGTSRPAHYVVLRDENKFGADQLQTLTHNLCFTFARATRSVSLCPPAYYADLLCERGRAYLHSVLKGEGAEA
ncbi:Piwi multi-domain protein [Pyrenophora tritici-repentis]|nr:Piwi multi-domain protein [Pyrenophora tritici-repentis]